MFLISLEFFNRKLMISSLRVDENSHKTFLSLYHFENLMKSLYTTYTGDENIEEEVALQIISAKDFYGINNEELLEKCLKQIKQKTNTHNCVKIFQTAYQVSFIILQI